MAFQDNLRRYRELAGYSQAKDFADTLGIKYTTYTAYENQGREPKFELLLKMAEILNVTTDDLLGNTSISPDEKKKKKVCTLFKQAGLPISENNELTISLTYGGFFTFELPKDDFYKKTFEILDEGEELGDKYVLEKIKFFFTSGKNLKQWFDDQK